MTDGKEIYKDVLTDLEIEKLIKHCGGVAGLLKTIADYCAKSDDPKLGQWAKNIRKILPQKFA